jgi:tRNA1Val (adenine37-N6)-methyltransferase
MPNNYFRFRQFTVFQDECAMKVCTDACLFGAWVASIVRDRYINVLDVGTGTGLLSLMIAQATEGRIDAVEIDGQAFVQAKKNFSSSPWPERLFIYHQPVQLFNSSRKYDLVVANPPFYETDLKSPDERRNDALHSGSLTIGELVPLVKSFMADEGKFAIVLPSKRMTEFEMLAAKNAFAISHKAVVRQTPRHVPFRVMYIVKNADGGGPVEYEEMTIKENDRYTDRFHHLLEDYYLFEKKEK